MRKTMLQNFSLFLTVSYKFIWSLSSFANDIQQVIFHFFSHMNLIFVRFCQKYHDLTNTRKVLQPYIWVIFSKGVQVSKLLDIKHSVVCILVISSVGKTFCLNRKNFRQVSFCSFSHFGFKSRTQQESRIFSTQLSQVYSQQIQSERNIYHNFFFLYEFKCRARMT